MLPFFYFNLGIMFTPILGIGITATDQVKVIKQLQEGVALTRRMLASQWGISLQAADALIKEYQNNY